MVYVPTTWVNNSTPALNAANLNNMETGIDDAHDCANITNTPAGNIAATNVQAAIDELETEKENTVTAHHARHVTGGGDVIADAIAAGNSGLMSGADKTKIDGVEAAADVTDTANVTSAGALMETTYNAQSVVIAVTDDTPVALGIAAAEILGRTAAGNVDSLTMAEVRAAGMLNIEDGADVTANNAPQAHNQSANTITSGILAVANGGTGVSGNTYDAKYVDGRSPGTYPNNVYKIPSALAHGDIIFSTATPVLSLLSPGTNGYQLTTHAAGANPTWSAASDLIWSDTHCPKCGELFDDGDILVMYIVGHNEVGDILTIPMHQSCSLEPKKTVILRRKVFEDQYIFDEDTGETVIQRVHKTTEKTTIKHKMKEDYELNARTGKVHKKGKSANVAMVEALEDIEETVYEGVYEDVKYEI